MKYKKLTLVFLVILFLIGFVNVSFASDTETVPDGFIELDCNASFSRLDSLVLPDFSDIVNPYIGKYIICETSGNYCLFVLSDIDKAISVDGEANGVYFYSNDGTLLNVPIYIFPKDSSGSEWTFFGADNHVYGVYYEQHVWRINIYNPDGTTFFFTTAQESPLAKVVKEAETQEVIQQIVMILPLILVVVVSFLGLRKAWAVLSHLLMRA